MGHRAKHRRANWPAGRLEKALNRARNEAKRPAPKPRVRAPRRVLPVLSFLGIHR